MKKASGHLSIFSRSNSPMYDQQRKVILDAANDAGLSWGGTFSKKPDYPHFYYDPGGRTQKIVDAQKAYCEISGRCK